MGRMGKDGYSSANTTQLSAKVPEELKEAFRELCEAKGESMTAEITQMMRDAVETDQGASTDPEWLPEDDKLADAWRVLDDICAPDTRKIDVKTAKSVVADRLNHPKKAVRKTIFRPMDRHDPPLIIPKGGKIFVRTQADLEALVGADESPQEAQETDDSAANVERDESASDTSADEGEQ